MKDAEEIVTANRLASDLLSMEAPLPADDALRHATLLAEALRRMHQEGAAGGCVDPDRIVWSKHGVKLMQNEVRGITAYASPEQVRGEELDARSDIFSFGAIVYELFSGRKAFPARDPEELKREILERTPTPLTGVSDEMAQLVGRCLEKRREDRWQRINSILIELKLAHASARQAHSTAEWREKLVSLRSQIAGQEARLTAQQAEREGVEADLRQAIQRLEEMALAQGAEIAGIHQTLAALHDSIAALQKGEQLHSKAIEGLETAASQTDEVVEHVVEAFGKMHQTLVERGESKVLLVSRNAS